MLARVFRRATAATGRRGPPPRAVRGFAGASAGVSARVTGVRAAAAASVAAAAVAGSVWVASRATAAAAKAEAKAPVPVTTPDSEYIGGIKVWNTGIMEDPIPGEKRGKGVPALNSSYWMRDLNRVLDAHLHDTLLPLARHAYEHTRPDTAPDYDFRFFLNYANQLFMSAENEGLATERARERFLLASWLTMAAAEVDHYPNSKYDAQQRAQVRERFYQRLFAAAQYPYQLDADATRAFEAKTLSVAPQFATPLGRHDLVPPFALERLGLHDELCVLKWGEQKAYAWLIGGFPLSKRMSSAKRHFDGAHNAQYEEDHIAHLIWSFMAIYHVATVFPHLNDLPNYEAIRTATAADVAAKAKTNPKS